MTDLKGLYKKYDVKYQDGTPLEDGAFCFVLRIDKERSARSAARMYAICSKNDKLLADLQEYDEEHPI